MKVSGPIKYVKLFLRDITKSDPNGKVSDFVENYNNSRALRGIINNLYPNIKISIRETI